MVRRRQRPVQRRHTWRECLRNANLLRQYDRRERNQIEPDERPPAEDDPVESEHRDREAHDGVADESAECQGAALRGFCVIAHTSDSSSRWMKCPPAADVRQQVERYASGQVKRYSCVTSFGSIWVSSTAASFQMARSLAPTPRSPEGACAYQVHTAENAATASTSVSTPR